MNRDWPLTNVPMDSDAKYIAAASMSVADIRPLPVADAEEVSDAKIPFSNRDRITDDGRPEDDVGQLSSPTSSEDDDVIDGAGVRAATESVVGLVIAVMLFRAFVGEAYMVPSGSMATALVGYHKKAICPTCQNRFDVGVEEKGWRASAVECPSCGTSLTLDPLTIHDGDRLLVLKGLYDWRPAHRWEMVVFRNPNEPRQAYVKRMVGFPGETIRLVGGDVFINGAVARKNYEQYRRMAVLVYEEANVLSQRHELTDLASRRLLGSRWHPTPASPGRLTLWQLDGTSWRIDHPFKSDLPDMLVYHHFDARREAGPVRDHIAYDANRAPWEEELVGDLGVSFILEYRGGDGTLSVVLETENDHRFRLVWEPSTGKMILEHNHESVAEASFPAGALQSGAKHQIDFALVDRAAIVAVDGRATSLVYQLDSRPDVSGASIHRRTINRPVSIGVAGVAVTIERLRIERDVHYTSRVAERFRMTGIEAPYTLGADEYFMLGDNSPISNDSRLWDQAAVPARLFIGKPVMVHWPTNRTGRFAWPDWSRIRRLH